MEPKRLNGKAGEDAYISRSCSALAYPATLAYTHKHGHHRSPAPPTVLRQLHGPGGRNNLQVCVTPGTIADPLEWRRETRYTLDLRVTDACGRSGELISRVKSMPCSCVLIIATGAMPIRFFQDSDLALQAASVPDSAPVRGLGLACASSRSACISQQRTDCC
jgi:hypothetical protein